SSYDSCAMHPRRPPPIKALAGILILGLVPRCSCNQSPGANGHPGSDAGGNPGPGSDGGASARKLRITPPPVMLTTDGTTPAMQASGGPAGANGPPDQDVTGGSLFPLADASLGIMNGPLFISNLAGGSTVLTAADGTDTATASITVKVSKIVVVPPGPGGAPI